MFVPTPGRRRPQWNWATPLLVLATVFAFLWVGGLDAAPRSELIRNWGAVPEALFPVGGWTWAAGAGQLPRLLTALFIHADWLHLLGNLMFLVIFGLPAERAIGGRRFLWMFLLCGALANLAAVLMIEVPRSVIVGSSGAVSAVIGAWLALFPKAKLGFVLPLGLFLEFVRAPASVMIGVWALLQLGFTFVGPGFGAVAWSAHASGFVLGFCFGLASRSAVARRQRQG